MPVPQALKGNDDYRKRSTACAESCSPAGSLHTVFQPGSRRAAPGAQEGQAGRALAPGSTSPGDSMERPCPAEGTGTPELISSSSPLVQHAQRVLNWRYRGSCHKTPWVTPTLSAAPIHNELTSEKPFNSMQWRSIWESQECAEELAQLLTFNVIFFSNVSSNTAWSFLFISKESSNVSPLSAGWDVYRDAMIPPRLLKCTLLKSEASDDSVPASSRKM